MATDKQRDIDQGWAWWVLLASYLNLLLCSGLSYVAGMFQVVFLQEFQDSVALTSWVTSLFSSFMQLGGPASSFVANIASCRVAVMVGGLCLSVGLTLSALQQSLGMLFAFFGVVAGIGLGLTFTSSVVVISYYFHRRRTMVTGIALSSGGLGIMLGPQISSLLFQMFSWREALGIMGVVSAQVCVLGALMFPMHETKTSPIVTSIHKAFKTFFSRRFWASLYGKCRKNERITKDAGNGAATKLMPNGNTECLSEVDDPGRCRSKSCLENGHGTRASVQDPLLSPTEGTSANLIVNGRVTSDHLVGVNNSTPSLRSSVQGKAQRPHYHHHHYVLKQHHRHHGIGQSKFHPSHKSHDVSQSYYELSTSNNTNPNDHYPMLDLTQTFRSNRELHLSKSMDQHSRGKEVQSFHSKPLISQNGSATYHKRPDGSYSGQTSYERIGRTSSLRHRSSASVVPHSSTSHLRLTVVPHNPSLLSLAGSSHHLDLVVHNDNQPSSVQNHLDSKNQLYKGLFGIDKTKASELASSHTSLKSAQSKSYLHLTDIQSLPISEELDPNLASSVISIAHAHDHVSGKDPNRPLYRNGAFMLLCAQLFVANCACGVFNIHMPSFTMSKGLSDQEVTNILSINGLALFNGRMLVGALASATGFDLLIYWALHMIGGIFIIILPVAGTSYLNFCFLIYGVGTFFGSVYSVLTSLTLKYVGLSRLATAFGLEMVFAGVGYLVAPPVAGLLVDLTGSYDYDMYCGGALLILSALILMFLPLLEPEVTREDIRRFLEGDVIAPEGHATSGVEVEVKVKVEACGDCQETGVGDDDESIQNKTRPEDVTVLRSIRNMTDYNGESIQDKTCPEDIARHVVESKRNMNNDDGDESKRNVNNDDGCESIRNVNIDDGGEGLHDGESIQNGMCPEDLAVLPEAIRDTNNDVCGVGLHNGESIQNKMCPEDLAAGESIRNMNNGDGCVGLLDGGGDKVVCEKDLGSL